MSKYYGESETRLAQMWELCEEMGKVIIFID
jgi:SpoVK/Ycf46/Vps4 family AAA+-type ATPase